MPEDHVDALSNRMAEAIRDKPFEARSDRIRAYREAGIVPAWAPIEEYFEADAIAEVQELSRRLTE